MKGKIVLTKENENSSTVKVICADKIITYREVRIKKMPFNSKTKKESIVGEVKRLMLDGYQVDKTQLMEELVK